MKIRMNKLTDWELKSMKVDFMIALVAWILLCIFVWWKIEHGEIGPLLKNNPCAPGYQVFVDGEDVGCTNAAANGERWRPTLRD